MEPLINVTPVVCDSKQVVRVKEKVIVTSLLLVNVNLPC